MRQVSITMRADFQLHTVHQELFGTASENLLTFSFNSTRYIRNPATIPPPSRALQTFNSTRYIRNQLFFLSFFRWDRGFQLHTVHQERFQGQGAGAQLGHFQLHTVHQELNRPGLGTQSLRRLSTPHGTLGTARYDTILFVLQLFQLHTVHQELVLIILLKVS